MALHPALKRWAILRLPLRDKAAGAARETSYGINFRGLVPTAKVECKFFQTVRLLSGAALRRGSLVRSMMTIVVCHLWSGQFSILALWHKSMQWMQINTPGPAIIRSATSAWLLAQNEHRGCCVSLSVRSTTACSVLSLILLFILRSRSCGTGLSRYSPDFGGSGMSGAPGFRRFWNGADSTMPSSKAENRPLCRSSRPTIRSTASTS